MEQTARERIPKAQIIALTALILGLAFLMPAHAVFQSNVLISGLNAPSDIISLPDGRMLVSERTGTVRVVMPNGTLLAQPLLDISDHVNTGGDRGLLSLAVDNNFAQNGYIYLLYTYAFDNDTTGSGPKTSRLTRVQLPSAGASATVPLKNPAETVLLGTVSLPPGYVGTPACTAGSDCIPADANAHTIGKLIIAPDNTMYVSMGDGASAGSANTDALRAQNIDWLAGKVLRVSLTGQGLASNPFYNGNASAARSKVYQYGLRNPYRMTLHPTLGLYVFDVGWNTWEEINRAGPGANFGWPCYEGNGTQPQYQSAFQQCRRLSASSVTKPAYTYQHTAIGGSIIGGAFANNTAYPAQYQGNLFWGDYSFGVLRNSPVSTNGNITSALDFQNGTFGIVDVVRLPNGNIAWMDIYAGQVIQFNWTSDTNTAPIAAASSNVTGGPVPMSVQFWSTGSSDPDGTPLSYLWLFGDGTSSTLANPTHTYAQAGNVTVTLRVSDGQLNSTATLTLQPGNNPPNVVINTPANNATFAELQQINFSGSATDPEEGPIPAAQVNWRLIAHHLNHTHVLLDNYHQYSGSTVQDYHGTDTIFELELSATDSKGLSASKSVWFAITTSSTGICQFATSAQADSQQPTYQAIYATGAPNADGQCTSSAGGVSWAPTSWSVPATLNVTFPTPVYAKNLTVFGDQGMSWASIWVQNDQTGDMIQVSGPTTVCNFTQVISQLPNFTTSKVMLVKTTLDWSATDAVRLCGLTQNTTNGTIIPDTTPPIISNVRNTSITNVSATIAWDTNENANATLRHGTSANSLTASQSTTASATTRSFTLTGLSPNTTYYYNATSCDAAGNCNTSGPFSLKTAANNATGTNATICQYASVATSDSQQPTYLAQYATGAPNADGQCTSSAGGVSWAPTSWSVPATLNLTFPTPVHVKSFTVFGDQGMSWASIWVQNDQTGQMVQIAGASTACNHTQNLTVAPNFTTSKIMLVKTTFDWSATDAVQMCGSP